MREPIIGCEISSKEILIVKGEKSKKIEITIQIDSKKIKYDY